MNKLFLTIGLCSLLMAGCAPDSKDQGPKPEASITSEAPENAPALIKE